LGAEIGKRRRVFDQLNLSVLTAFLEGRPLRSGLSAAAIAEEFRVYMFF